MTRDFLFIFILLLALLSGFFLSINKRLTAFCRVSKADAGAVSGHEDAQTEGKVARVAKRPFLSGLSFRVGRGNVASYVSIMRQLYEKANGQGLVDEHGHIAPLVNGSQTLFKVRDCAGNPLRYRPLWNSVSPVPRSFSSHRAQGRDSNCLQQLGMATVFGSGQTSSCTS